MTKRDADYFSQKYSLTRTHSEVLHAATIVPPGRALDPGLVTGVTAYLAANGFCGDGGIKSDERQQSEKYSRRRATG